MADVDMNASLVSETSSKTSNSARRSCVKCNRLVLGKTEPHDTCIDCLGKFHSMLDCVECQSLSVSSKVLRARRLAHWQFEGSGVCPSINTVKALVKTKPVPHHLQFDVISKFFTPESESDHTEQESDPNEGGNDEDNVGNILLSGLVDRSDAPKAPMLTKPAASSSVSTPVPPVDSSTHLLLQVWNREC